MSRGTRYRGKGDLCWSIYEREIPLFVIVVLDLLRVGYLLLIDERTGFPNQVQKFRTFDFQLSLLQSSRNNFNSRNKSVSYEN